MALIKLNQIANLTRNSRTNQISFNIRKKQMDKFGLTPNQLLGIKIPKALIIPQKKKLIPIKLKAMKMEAYR